MQRYYLLIKFLVLIPSIVGITFLVTKTTPEISNILIVAILFGLSFLIILSFFINSRISLLLAVGATFLLFLKAVKLVTPINLGLFGIFIVLLAFYFRKTPMKKESEPNKIILSPKHTLFPKGWPGRGKKKV